MPSGCSWCSLGLRRYKVAAALVGHGCSDDDLSEGWRLLQRVIRTRLGLVAAADAGVLDEIDAWENKGVPVASATLKRHTPPAHAFITGPPSRTPGARGAERRGAVTLRVGPLPRLVLTHPPSIEARPPRTPRQLRRTALAMRLQHGIDAADVIPLPAPLRVEPRLACVEPGGGRHRDRGRGRAGGRSAAPRAPLEPDTQHPAVRGPEPGLRARVVHSGLRPAWMPRSTPRSASMGRAERDGLVEAAGAEDGLAGGRGRAGRGRGGAPVRLARSMSVSSGSRRHQAGYLSQPSGYRPITIGA